MSDKDLWEAADRLWLVCSRSHLMRYSGTSIGEFVRLEIWFQA